MGIERTVTLWYVHRQMLLNELALLEARLVQIHSTSDSEVGQSEVWKGASPFPAGRMEVEERYRRVQEMLRNLGPCPRAMMG